MAMKNPRGKKSAHPPSARAGVDRERWLTGADGIYSIAGAGFLPRGRFLIHRFARLRLSARFFRNNSIAHLQKPAGYLAVEKRHALPDRRRQVPGQRRVAGEDEAPPVAEVIHANF